MARRVQIAIDCSDPQSLAQFWIQALSYRLVDPPGGHPTWEDFSAAEANTPGERWCLIADPAAQGPTLLFHTVPEPKDGKNRVHLDFWVEEADDGTPRPAIVQAEADRLASLGATHLRTRNDDGDFYIVMQDPEGNEFCVA